MTHEDFLALSEAAWGKHWQKPLAAVLCITTRTLQRWAAGASPIPKDMAMTITISAHAESSQRLERVKYIIAKVNAK